MRRANGRRDERGVTRVIMAKTNIHLWVANAFGMNSMGIHAHAAADAHVGGVTASCIKPFLLPDMWSENGAGEDANHDKMIQSAEKWDYEPSGTGDGLD